MKKALIIDLKKRPSARALLQEKWITMYNGTNKEEQDEDLLTTEDKVKILNNMTKYYHYSSFFRMLISMTIGLGMDKPLHD